MLFKVMLTRIVEQDAEAEIEAEDIDAAEAIARKRFKAGEFEWDDTSVEHRPQVIFSAHGIGGSGYQTRRVQLDRKK